MIERLFAQFLALSRWLLVASELLVITNVLKLVDLTLTASLIVIIIFSGYANFVSRIEAEPSPAGRSG